MDPSSYIKDEKITYLLFHKTCDKHIWQTGELSWVSTTSKITWPWDRMDTWSHVTYKKWYISTLMRAITAKLDKEEVYSKGPPSIESLDALITWSSDHVTDGEPYISTSARPTDTKFNRVMGFNAGLLSTN